MPEEYTTAEDPDGKPIYSGAQLTIAASMTLILTFALTHNLTGVTITDLLTLISLHCLHPHPFLRSLHYFQKYFKDLRSPLVYHRYCSFCFTPITADQTTSRCPNTKCNRNLSEKGATSYFIEIPIVQQIQNLFLRPGFYNLLQHRFTRSKKHRDNIEDIYDGALYKKLFSDNGFLSNPHNISFLWNTDGVSIFKSSNFSIWSLYLRINELPPKERRKKENMIFAGLWFGNTKPLMLTYLEPLTKSIADIHREGVHVKSPDVPQEFICKGIVLCGTCDLPAKAIILNMLQFNGRYGCPKCK